METIQLRERDRNVIAALLSVVPGLGHLYKHHYVSGIGILLLGNLLMLYVTALLGLATFGLGLIIVPALYWGSMMYSAYHIDDWHGKYDYLHPWRDHSEED